MVTNDDWGEVMSVFLAATEMPASAMMGPQGMREESEAEHWHRSVRKMQRKIERGVWGARAPGRKRPRRVAKKIAQRGGAMHYGCPRALLGSLVTMAVRWTT